MSSIEDLLNKAEAQSFVGRLKELQLMHEQLSLGQTRWQILHFFAIKGMGKSTLLKRFARTSSASKMIYLHTDMEFQSPKQFLDQIAKELNNLQSTSSNSPATHEVTGTYTEVVCHLNALASRESPFILLFDALELWNPIMEWLFEFFIPKLSANIRLFTAGTEPLDGKWISSSSWNLLVQNIPLEPLHNNDVRTYLELAGVHEPMLQHTIIKLSNGIPFAMNLCCKRLHHGEHPSEDAGLKLTIRMLCQTVFEGLQLSAKQYALVEAASVVGQFDKELIMHITQQWLDYEEFDQLCNTPIVVKRKGGWSLADGIRNWIQTDFKEHSPELFNRYKKRALEVLHRRWTAAAPMKRRSLFLENVYAAENELLREYYFLGDESVYDIRTAREEDLPVMENIWKNRHLNHLQSVNDGTEQEKLFLSVWQLEPASFKIFWVQDRIVGFASIVPFTREVREIFYRNELYQRYLMNTEVEENERLFWVAGTVEKDDYASLNVIFRYLFEQLMDNCLCTVLIPTDYDISGLLKLGFNELQWAASASPTGKQFRMLQLDLREMSLLRLLTTSYPGKAKRSVTHLEAVQWTKKILASFHDFEFDRELLEQSVTILGKEDDFLPDVQIIRNHIHFTLQEVAGKSEKDRVMMRALQLTYIDRIGSNEVIAERLHLSISTFYRYIKNGIENVALQLISKSGAAQEF